MSSSPSKSPTALVLGVVLAGALAGSPDPVLSWSPPQGAASRPSTSLLHLSGSPAARTDRLHAQLWMDLSPEYRALCRQVFNSALHSITQVVHASPGVDGSPRGGSGKPLAIVADLDETILDNSGYQAQLVLEGADFTPSSWDAWVVQGSGVGLVPGAGRFLRRVADLGVTILYLSNRSERRRASTLETLRRLEIDFGIPDSEASRPRLLLQTDHSDKEPRRLALQAHFEIVAYLGDNLGDFPRLVGRQQKTRLDQVERLDALWGTRWFVLPNPLYGSWTRPFDDRNPSRVLREHLVTEGIH